MKFDAWLKKNDVDTFTKRDMPLTHLDKAILDDDAQPVKPTTYGVLLDEDMDLEAGEAPAGARYAVGPYSELDHDDDDEEIDEETYQSITRRADPFLATPSTWSPMDSVAVSKIGWTDEAREAAAEARRRLGTQTKREKTIPHIDHAVYTDPDRKGVSPATAKTPEKAAKMLEDRLPDWSREDHAEAAEHHREMANHHYDNLSKMVEAHKVPGFHSTPEWKQLQDYYAKTALMHANVADAHRELSKR